MTFDSKGSDHEEMADLCGGYALGVLDPADSARFEIHLGRGCEACAAELKGHRATLEAIGSALEPVDPPSGAEGKLLSLVGSSSRPEGREPASPRSPAFLLRPRWLLAAALLLMTAPVVWLALEVGRLKEELSAFETTTDPIVTIIDLEPTDRAGGGRARATFDPRTGLWRLFAHDMPDPLEGLAYQGWLVTSEGTLDFGSFRPDATGHGFLRLEHVAGPEGIRIAVTLEPEGGSAAPSGPPVFGPASTARSPAPVGDPVAGAPD